MKKIWLVLALVLMPMAAMAEIDKKIDTPQNRAILTGVEKAYNGMRTFCLLYTSDAADEL